MPFRTTCSSQDSQKRWSEITDPVLPGIIYFALNGITLILFAFDKVQARQEGWRIRETTLLILAFLGPFGALGGMLLLRHKTRKPLFLLVPAFALLHGIMLMILLPDIL